MTKDFLLFSMLQKKDTHRLLLILFDRINSFTYYVAKTLKKFHDPKCLMNEKKIFFSLGNFFVVVC